MLVLQRNLLARGGRFASLHPIVRKWSERVIDLGGQEPSGQTKLAASKLIESLSHQLLLGRMLMVNVVAPDNITAAMTPLIFTEGGVGPTELITNGGFELGFAGWSNPNSSTLTIMEGGLFGKFINITHNPSTRGMITQGFTTTPGRLYRITVWFCKGNNGGRGRVVVGTSPGGSQVFTFPTLSLDGWRRYFFYFTATSSTTYISLQQDVEIGAPFSARFDQVSVVQASCYELWENNGFVVGDLSGFGLKGRSSAWANTGFNPNNFPEYLPDLGVSMLCSEANTTEGGMEFGMRGTGVGFGLQYRDSMSSPNTSFFWAGNYSTMSEGEQWFFGSSRIQDMVVHTRGGRPSLSYEERTSEMSSSIPSASCGFLAQLNLSGSPVAYSTARVRFLAVHRAFEVFEHRKLWSILKEVYRDSGNGGFKVLDEDGRFVLDEHGAQVEMV